MILIFPTFLLKPLLFIMWVSKASGLSLQGPEDTVAISLFNASEFALLPLATTIYPLIIFWF